MKNILFIGLLFAFTMTAYGQKFGYINTQELLGNMAELKAADEELMGLQKKLLDEGDAMVEEFEKNYNAYMEEANSGMLSKVQMQKKEEELIKKQEELKAYETEIQNQVLKRKEELYTPILERVKQEIKKLGDEEGYTMIFDGSVGLLLHASESEDLLPKLKKRMGLN